MSAAVQISLGEYLSNTYEPDYDYVDGALEERSVGLRGHSRTQTLFTAWHLHEKKLMVTESWPNSM